VLDGPSFVWAMRPSRRPRAAKPIIYVRNRRERVDPGPQSIGAACRWHFTTDLHVARIFPSFGGLLMRRTLRDWPITLPATAPAATTTPDVTFVIGHRGLERLPHLHRVLQSIAAQVGVAVECVLVEQSPEPLIANRLPAWVRYVHTPMAETLGYSRAAAFNAGMRHARARLLIFHDNDMLLPREYAMQALLRQRDGFEVINLKRFVFYLTDRQSTRIQHTGEIDADDVPETVVQNLEAGGSFAITRDAYRAIGGFDEGFIGWGGEDNEFWERAITRRAWVWGYLPILHLWHPPQPEKVRGAASPAVARYWRLTRIPPAERIRQLVGQSGEVF